MRSAAYFHAIKRIHVNTHGIFSPWRKGSVAAHKRTEELRRPAAALQALRLKNDSFGKTSSSPARQHWPSYTEKAQALGAKVSASDSHDTSAR